MQAPGPGRGSRGRGRGLYYFGRSFGVEEALELGLLNWIVPDGEFQDVARRRALELAALPRSAVRIGRSTFFELASRSHQEGFRYSAERLVELLTDPEVARSLAGRSEGR